MRIYENFYTYINIPLMLFPERVVEASQIFLRDTHVLPRLLCYKEYRRRDWWQVIRHLIAVYLRCEC
jgi:hypothetical protein